MSDADLINKAREELDAALATMRRVWVDAPASDETLSEAQECARFASELISDLRKRLNAQG